jgi:uncharacterized protein DUF4390
VKRRRFVLGLLSVPLVGFARPENLVPRKASFEEVGNSVLMTVSVPTLFRRTDRDALDSIDSGFITTLHFTLRVWRVGKRQLIDTRELLVKIHYDVWKKKYIVRTRESGVWTSKRAFLDRDEAIAAAVKLDRVRVAAANDLERGETGPYYFVEIFAQRNPLDPPEDFAGSTSAQGRDLEWFGRLVDVLAGERAEAEETVHLRSNWFFLEAR